MQGHEIASAWDAWGNALTSEREATQATLDDLNQRRVAMVADLEAAGKELAAVFVPALTNAALTDAEKRTGFRGFSRFDPIKAKEKEAQKLTVDIATINADPRYVRREWLVGPHGEITQKLEEAKSMLAPWEVECFRFEGEPEFMELLQVGYDTPAFSLRWWDTRYWKLWAAGDRICEKLGLADFGDDVLPAYHKAREPRDQWAARVRAVVAEIREIHDLVQRHDQAVDRLARLDEIYLDECRAALGKHLQSADAALIETWSPDDRAVMVGARKVAGCKAKLAYLDEMKTGLSGQVDRMAVDTAKASRKADKFRRSKNYYSTFSGAMAPTGGDERVVKLRTAREKLLDAADRMQRYDRYAAFDLQQNDSALWWFEMTGRRPGPYLSTTRGWYDRNPSAVVCRDGVEADTSAAIADALADRAHDGLGDLS